MSSMDRIRLLSFTFVSLTALSSSAPGFAQDAASWDRNRAQLVASQPGRMAGAISRWSALNASAGYSFADYAGFLLGYPGFPREETMRRRAEAALRDEPVDAGRIAAFFDRFPALTNAGRARYALALGQLGRPEAIDTGRAAWRAGPMSAMAELTLQQTYGAQFTPDDHDARMNALLWAGDAEAAVRQIAYVSPQARPVFMARLALLQGQTPESIGLQVPAVAQADPGYIHNRVAQLRRNGAGASAASYLANLPRLARPAYDPEAFLTQALAVARSGSGRDQVAIAQAADGVFLPGIDISGLSYRIRDDYTSLMWLGGTEALWNQGRGRDAAPLFYQYGAAAQTPQTRSKGFYWAGLAAERGGDRAEAQRYLDMAAGYPDQFYGLLALERLGRPIPELGGDPAAGPTAAERAAFQAKPITAAVREVAVDADWATGIQFYRELADQADTAGEHLLVADFAREIGRRDLAVIDGQAAAADGLAGFTGRAFPTVPTPPGTDWTMVHAISRQESQFADNAVSHAGARGLMQLMPGTAREQAGKSGLAYMSASLTQDPAYNIRLGDAYFARMMEYFGSYPLAVAAYNAGAGNVNKWLRANGDPRSGSVPWVEWIEKIPFYETKNYVQRVLENAVVYEALYPDKALYGRPRGISQMLGKSQPG